MNTASSASMVHEQPFSSLRVRNFRYFAGGHALSSIGTWAQRVAQDWLVLTLSGGDPVALGVMIAVQFAPTVLLSLWAGALADRLDKRKMLIWVQLMMGAQSLILGGLVLGGLVALWHVYVLSVVFGCLASLEMPMRQSFVAEIVGKERIPNAVSVNSTIINLGRMAGPAIAGVLIVAVGTGWVFLGYTAATMVMAGALAAMDPARLQRGPAVRRARGQVREGLRYVRERVDLIVAMTMVFFISTFGITFFVSLAIVARTVFHTQADGYGLLSALLSAGTFTGAIVGALRRKGGSQLRLLLAAAMAFGALEVLIGFVPTFGWFAAMLVPLGFLSVTFLNSANSFVQTAVDQEVRGRVMGLYMLVLVGGTPIAGLFTGWLAGTFGGRFPFFAGGAISLIVAIGCAIGLANAHKRSGAPVDGAPAEQA